MIIQAQNLTRKYKSGLGEIVALKNVDLTVKKGEFLAITGRSGSGKSTLLYQLGLLDRPTSGDIYIEDVNVSNFSDIERTHLRLKELGYIFQDYAILPSLTALENVTLPLLMMGLDSREIKKKAETALGKVSLGHRFSNLPSQLSGGEQQRVSIARAISHDPKIIFADEPTANLDSETSKVILQVFLELHKEGQTIVMVTHEKEYATVADRVITLSDGEIIKESRGSLQ
ncbi:MAG: ABC transporter ATP-binding protein [Candidatus Liptonbacteria bacterium]|nr:ABC transporter ATP-binding protein [Candidatus Liptonbacteria bacterium]